MERSLLLCVVPRVARLLSLCSSSDTHSSSRRFPAAASVSALALALSPPERASTQPPPSPSSGWTRDINEADAKAKPKKSEEEHRRALDELSTQQDEHQRSYRKKEDELSAAKGSAAALKAEIERLRKQKADLKQNKTMARPSKLCVAPRAGESGHRDRRRLAGGGQRAVIPFLT